MPNCFFRRKENSMKKITSIILCLVFLASVFCGCAKSELKSSSVKLKPGETVKLLADDIYEKLGDDAEIVWSTEDEKIVTVDDGKVTYVAKGEATVTASGTSSDKKKEAEKKFKITCLAADDESLTLDKYYLNLTEDGQSAKITATAVNNGDKIKSWKSSDEKVATVNDGTVTRVSAGRAEITVETQMGYTQTCFVMCDSVVMKLGDYEVTDSMFGYWVASYKTQIVEYNIGEDSEEIWKTEIEDGKTFKDLFNENVYDSVVQILEAVASYDPKSRDNNDELNASVLEAVNNAVDANGGEEKMNKVLSNFYVDLDIMTKVFTYEEITNRCYESEFGEGGKNVIPDEELKEYFDDNYAHAKHIWFDTSYKYVDGEPVELTEEESNEKTKLANDVFEKIKKGKLKFEDGITKYSDDDIEYSDGFVFCHGEGITEEFDKAVFDMKNNEVRLVETEYGLHIVKRFKLTDDDYNEDIKASIKDKLENERFEKLLAPYGEKIEGSREDVTKKYDVVKIPLFSQLAQ